MNSQLRTQQEKENFIILYLKFYIILVEVSIGTDISKSKSFRVV